MERAPVLPVDAALDAILSLPPKDRPVLSAAIRHRCAVVEWHVLRNYESRYERQLPLVKLVEIRPA